MSAHEDADVVVAARQLTGVRRTHEFAASTSRPCPVSSVEKLRRLYRRGQALNDGARRVAQERNEARAELRRIETIVSDPDPQRARDAKGQDRLKRDLELARTEFSRLCGEADAAAARATASVTLVSNLVKWLRSAGYSIPEDFNNV